MLQINSLLRKKRSGSIIIELTNKIIKNLTKINLSCQIRIITLSPRVSPWRKIKLSSRFKINIMCTKQISNYAKNVCFNEKETRARDSDEKSFIICLVASTSNTKNVIKL